MNILKNMFGDLGSVEFATKHSPVEDPKLKVEEKDANQAHRVSLQFVQNVWGSAPGESLMTAGELQLSATV